MEPISQGCSQLRRHYTDIVKAEIGNIDTVSQALREALVEIEGRNQRLEAALEVAPASLALIEVMSVPGVGKRAQSITRAAKGAIKCSLSVWWGHRAECAGLWIRGRTDCAADSAAAREPAEGEGGSTRGR